MDYFTDIVTSTNPTNFSDTIAGIANRVNPSMGALLNQDFNASEVHQAVFQLNSNSAPGPDGLSANFFQSYWDIIGEEITSYILDILNMVAALGPLITLISASFPKTNTQPSHLTLDLLLYVMLCSRLLLKPLQTGSNLF
jgi:hypothetical protein